MWQIEESGLSHTLNLLSFLSLSAAAVLRAKSELRLASIVIELARGFRFYVIDRTVTFHEISNEIAPLYAS